MIQKALILFILVIFAQTRISNATRTVDSCFSDSDSLRLQEIFRNGLKSTDLQTIYFSAINSKKVPDDTKSLICGSSLVQSYKESKLNDYEKDFYYIGASTSLLCRETIPANIMSHMKASMNKEYTSTQEMYYTLQASKLLDSTVMTDELQARLSKNLRNLLKKDDSLQSLGFGFSIASELGQHGLFALDYIEDAMAQADEVDDKMLQFEGGISLTSLIVNGALKVSSKKLPINSEQAEKFATYFLSRRSVTSAKGASSLLESLRAIMGRKEINPAAIRVANNGRILPDTPILTVLITDLFCQPLAAKLTDVKVTITSKDTSLNVLEKVNIVPTASNPEIFKLDVSSKKLPKGSFNLAIDAGDFKQSNIPITVLGKVRLEKIEMSISEKDSSASAKKVVLDQTSKLTEVHTLDHQQKLGIRFDLLEDASGKIMSVHQVFVKFSTKSGSEIIFIAEQDVTKAYKLEIDVGLRSGDFGGRSGLYSLEIFIGDSLLANFYNRHLGEIQLKFPMESKKDSVRSPLTLRKARSEIVHLFREPEKRPPRFVSDVFTALCFAPFFVLFIMWGRLGINVSNFKFSLSALGFHAGLAAIFSLFICFWQKLDMFQTVKYLVPIAFFTFLCGNKVLRFIANKRLDKN